MTATTSGPGCSDLAVAAEFDNNGNGRGKLTTASTGTGSTRTITFTTSHDTDTDDESIPMSVVFTGANLGSDDEQDITIDITDDE